MMLDAAITILNFDLAKAVGLERDFQGEEQCPVPKVVTGVRFVDGEEQTQQAA